VVVAAAVAAATVAVTVVPPVAIVPSADAATVLPTVGQ